ncbi:MAG: hypothetical protein WCY77_03935 [Weeksellaceae bacterium]
MKRFGFLIILSFFFVSCGQTAIGYNDSVIRPQIEISAYLDSIFLANSSYNAIHSYREEMVKNAEEGLSKIRVLDDFKGNESYRESAQKYYSFVATYFSSTLEIDSILYQFNSPERLESVPQERIEQIRKNFQHFQELEENLLNEQQKFAEEFNLKL